MEPAREGFIIYVWNKRSEISYVMKSMLTDIMMDKSYLSMFSENCEKGY